jgi:hypothetical protein
MMVVRQPTGKHAERARDRLRFRVLPLDLKLFLALPVLLTVGLLQGKLAGQSGERRVATLERDAAYPEPFSYLSGVRELSDGTVLAADPTSEVVLRLDMETGTADTLGREGAGPQEYDGPDRVFPLPGDSTLLVDLGNGRLVVIDPEGTFVSWTPMATSNKIGRLRILHPTFVDAAGNIYSLAPYWQDRVPDTSAINRINRAKWEETPVAWIWHPEREWRPRTEKQLILVAYDSWAVGDDGRVAVVRANGYSVDWYFPDGQVIRGPPNDVDVYPLRRADKEAAVEARNANTIWARTTGSATEITSIRSTRGSSSSNRWGIDDFEWPSTLPTFGPGTIVSPQGEAWVARMMPAGEPARYDVFDESGTRLGFIELSPGSKVIGFGTGRGEKAVAYVTHTDDVGFVWLERYRVLRTNGPA